MVVNGNILLTFLPEAVVAGEVVVGVAAIVKTTRERERERDEKDISIKSLERETRKNTHSVELLHLGCCLFSSVSTNFSIRQEKQ